MVSSSDIATLMEQAQKVIATLDKLAVILADERIHNPNAEGDLAKPTVSDLSIDSLCNYGVKECQTANSITENNTTLSAHQVFDKMSSPNSYLNVVSTVPINLDIGQSSEICWENKVNAVSGCRSEPIFSNEARPFNARNVLDEIPVPDFIKELAEAKKIEEETMVTSAYHVFDDVLTPKMELILLPSSSFRELDVPMTHKWFHKLPLTKEMYVLEQVQLMGIQRKLAAPLVNVNVATLPLIANDPNHLYGASFIEADTSDLKLVLIKLGNKANIEFVRILVTCVHCDRTIHICYKYFDPGIKVLKLELCYIPTLEDKGDFRGEEDKIVDKYSRERFIVVVSWRTKCHKGMGNQAMYHCSLIMQDHFWPWMEQLDGLPHLGADTLSEFIPLMLSKAFMECYVARNIAHSEVVSTIEHIERAFFEGSHPHPICQPLSPSQHLTYRVVELNKVKNYCYVAKGLNASDALVHYVQVHQDDYVALWRICTGKCVVSCDILMNAIPVGETNLLQRVKTGRRENIDFMDVWIFDPGGSCVFLKEVEADSIVIAILLKALKLWFTSWYDISAEKYFIACYNFETIVAITLFLFDHGGMKRMSFKSTASNLWDNIVYWKASRHVPWYWKSIFMVDYKVMGKKGPCSLGKYCSPEANKNHQIDFVAITVHYINWLSLNYASFQQHKANKHELILARRDFDPGGYDSESTMRKRPQVYPYGAKRRKFRRPEDYQSYVFDPGGSLVLQDYESMMLCGMEGVMSFILEDKDNFKESVMIHTKNRSMGSLVIYSLLISFLLLYKLQPKTCEINL